VSPPLWPYAALSAGYFAHIGFFNPYLPLWLQDMGLSLVAISLLTSLQSATRLFAPYAWSWLSDHTGQRVWLLRYCGTAALCIALLLWFEWSTVGLFAVLLLMFTHTSAMLPLSETALAHAVSQQGHFDAKRYGRVRLWGSIGFLVTVVLAGQWFERHGIGSFPAWTAVTLLAVVFSVWAMPAGVEAAHGSEARRPMWPVLRQPPVAWFFASVYFHVLSHIFIYIFFSLYLDSLGYSKGVIGLVWATSVLVEIGWFFTQGRWLPALSLRKWLVLVSVVMALRMAVTASLADVFWLLLVAQAVHALTFAAHHSVCVAQISRLFPGNLRARGQALYAVIGYGLSGVTGGLVGGAVSSRFGLDAVFWLSALSAVCAALAAGVAGWWARKADRAERADLA